MAFGILLSFIYRQYVVSFATKPPEIISSGTQSTGLALTNTSAGPDSPTTGSGLAAGDDPTITPISTPTLVARVGDQVRTEKWAVTVFGAKRAEWLLWNDRRLEPAGWWLIVYG